MISKYTMPPGGDAQRRRSSFSPAAMKVYRPTTLYVIVAISLLLVASALTTACSSAASSQKKYSHPTQRPYRIYNRVYYPIPSAYGFSQTGIASWYGKGFHGRKTSNGETYNMYDMTAAHKTLPMNTMLLVKNLENNLETVVRVNDRGPFVKGRIIDLSYTAARKLRIDGPGTARVQIVALTERGKNENQMKEMAYQFYHGEFYVQIGSFTDPDNAIYLQQRFLEAGHKTVIKKYRSPDREFYRVQVYVGQTLQGAQQARNILEKRGYRNAFVVAQ